MFMWTSVRGLKKDGKKKAFGVTKSIGISVNFMLLVSVEYSASD